VTNHDLFFKGQFSELFCQFKFFLINYFLKFFLLKLFAISLPVSVHLSGNSGVAFELTELNRTLLIESGARIERHRPGLAPLVAGHNFRVF